MNEKQFMKKWNTIKDLAIPNINKTAFKKYQMHLQADLVYESGIDYQRIINLTDLTNNVILDKVNFGCFLSWLRDQKYSKEISDISNYDFTKKWSSKSKHIKGEKPPKINTDPIPVKRYEVIKEILQTGMVEQHKKRDPEKLSREIEQFTGGDWHSIADIAKKMDQGEMAIRHSIKKLPHETLYFAEKEIDGKPHYQFYQNSCKIVFVNELEEGLKEYLGKLLFEASCDRVDFSKAHVKELAYRIEMTLNKLSVKRKAKPLKVTKNFIYTDKLLWELNSHKQYVLSELKNDTVYTKKYFSQDHIGKCVLKIKDAIEKLTIVV